MTTATETTAWRFALIGTPNSGKTALFNALTGSRQKVANYPGVTVERKSGLLQTPGGRSVNLIDIARRRGIDIDLDRLSAELGVPVITAAAVRRGGTDDLMRRLDDLAL